jgi:viroplasmin and RNaseH domain-containing protein
MGQIVVIVAKVHGYTAATFSSLPVVENAEAITE